MRTSALQAEEKVGHWVPDDNVGPHIFERRIAGDTYAAYTYVEDAFDLRVESGPYTLIREEKVED